jgi:hypothetical protein
VLLLFFAEQNPEVIWASTQRSSKRLWWGDIAMVFFSRDHYDSRFSMFGDYLRSFCHDRFHKLTESAFRFLKLPRAVFHDVSIAK